MRGVLLEACDYHGPYPGTFIPSLIAVGHAVRERLGLDCVHVVPEAIRDRPWVQQLQDAGFHPRFSAAAGLRSTVGDLQRATEGVDLRLVRTHFTAFDLAGGVLARHRGARSVWHVHSGVSGHGARQQARDLVKVRALGALLCDEVIAVSDAIGRELVRRGHPRRRVAVVPNGLALDRFAPGRLPERGAARAALGVAPDARVVLAFGWHPRIKGVDLLLDACEALDVTLVLVGTEPLRAYLAGRFGAGLPPWLRAVDPVDDPGRLYAAADVFASASREEAFSYAIGEAMACGVPVVSSDVPGPAVYFAAEGVRTFRSEDAGDLRAALLAALDPARRTALGAANRAYVGQRLGLDRHVDAVVGRLERLLRAG